MTDARASWFRGSVGQSPDPAGLVSEQQRAAEASHEWFAGVVASVQEQAEAYAKLLAAMDTSLVSVSRAFEAQTQANRAVLETIEVSRESVATARVALERNTALTGELVEALTRMSGMQLDLLRSMAALGQLPAGSQVEAYQRLTRDWWDAYRNAMQAAMRRPPSPSS